MDADIIIVGSGFFGLTMAERCAHELALKVLVLESKDHIGGSAYSYLDPRTGIEMHRYGSHIFHTANEEVWAYAHRFTKFNEYRHRVMTVANGRFLPMPINLQTICSHFGRVMSPGEARDLIECSTASDRAAGSLEEKAIALVGRSLYEALIKGYTAKQWQKDPALLPPSIISRLPVRYNFDDRYFSDPHQGIPIDGYASWLSRMADHPNIEVLLSQDFFSLSSSPVGQIPVIYTGPLDRYFAYSEGDLGWRTLDFETEYFAVADRQGTAVINYADANVPFTRTHEFKHYHPERPEYDRPETVIVREYSRFANREDDPLYPINSGEDRARLQRYRRLAEESPGIVFGGRLGSYQYLDMHMTILSALRMFDAKIRPYFTGRQKVFGGHAQK